MVFAFFLGTRLYIPIFLFFLFTARKNTQVNIIIRVLHQSLLVNNVSSLNLDVAAVVCCLLQSFFLLLGAHYGFRPTWLRFGGGGGGVWVGFPSFMFAFLAVMELCASRWSRFRCVRWGRLCWLPASRLWGGNRNPFIKRKSLSAV